MFRAIWSLPGSCLSANEAIDAAVWDDAELNTMQVCLRSNIQRKIKQATTKPNKYQRFFPARPRETHQKSTFTTMPTLMLCWGVTSYQKLWKCTNSKKNDGEWVIVRWQTQDRPKKKAARILNTTCGLIWRASGKVQKFSSSSVSSRILRPGDSVKKKSLDSDCLKSCLLQKDR